MAQLDITLSPMDRPNAQGVHLVAPIPPVARRFAHISGPLESTDFDGSGLLYSSAAGVGPLCRDTSRILNTDAPLRAPIPAPPELVRVCGVLEIEDDVEECVAIVAPLPRAGI